MLRCLTPQEPIAASSNIRKASSVSHCFCVFTSVDMQIVAQHYGWYILAWLSKYYIFCTNLLENFNVRWFYYIIFHYFCHFCSIDHILFLGSILNFIDLQNSSIIVEFHSKKYRYYPYSVTVCVMVCVQIISLLFAGDLPPWVGPLQRLLQRVTRLQGRGPSMLCRVISVNL